MLRPACGVVTGDSEQKTGEKEDTIPTAREIADEAVSAKGLTWAGISGGES